NVELTLNEGNKKRLTTDASGSFETKLPEIASYALNVSADGYHSYSNKFSLPTFDRDTTLMVDIFLKPVDKKLVLKGEVFNKKTGEKMTADLDVIVREHRDVNLSMKARNGDYQREISKLGWYIISASAEGFINTTDSVWINSADV